MIIGVPRERKTLERRVALTPEGARELVRQGHTVLIEHEAGLGSFFDDREYAEAGCEIVPTLEALWSRAELIVKVKEPHADEYKFFRPTVTIFSYLHLAGLPQVAEAMLRGGIRGIAYELVRGEKGGLPLLEPMSEVAGRLSVLVGSYFLLTQNGGRGVLLSGAQAVNPGRVVIVGAGTAGRAACASAVGLGAEVVVQDISDAALARIRRMYGDKVRCLPAGPEGLAAEAPHTDLLIGAVLVPGARAPRVITRAHLAAMPSGAVFVDISVDQGGCAETTRATSLQEPTYVEEGVIHYAVQNMPSMTARTSTKALTRATLPYIELLAREGITGICRSSAQIRAAVCTWEGKLTEPHVAEVLGIPAVKVEDLLGQK